MKSLGLPIWPSCYLWREKEEERKRVEPPNQKKPPMPMSLDSQAIEQEGDNNNKIPK
jgi:hypothetical protein